MGISGRWKDSLIALAFCAAFVGGACVLFGDRSVPALAPARPPVLVIDAGHGGEDGGAVSPSGVTESGINLAIAQRLDLIAGLLGIDCVMLRDRDVSLHSAGAVTLREKKVSDLHNRVDAVNGIEGAVLISIHQNSYPDPRYGGAQVFYAPTDGSQALAQTLQETLRSCLDPDNTRKAKPIPDTIYLMNHVRCTAALAECGFLTNPEEEALLRSSKYQTKIAAALASGYLRSLTQEGERIEGENAVLLHPMRQ